VAGISRASGTVHRSTLFFSQSHMQAAQRLARHRALHRSVRCLATTASPNANAANAGVHVTSYTSTASTSAIPLSNVEAQWEKMTHEEQLSVHQQLEELQKKDWRELSLDEKKAGAFCPFFFLPLWLHALTRFPGSLLRSVRPSRTAGTYEPTWKQFEGFLGDDKLHRCRWLALVWN
jgi:hypothetical protein